MSTEKNPRALARGEVKDGGDGLHGLIKSSDHVAKIAESLKKGGMFVCQCGKEFWRKPSAIANGDAKFCSRACYQEWQRGKPKAIPKGGIPWNKGRPWSEAERKKISEGKRHAVR